MAEPFSIRKMEEADRNDWIDLYCALFPEGSRVGMSREIDQILASEKRDGFCAENAKGILGFVEYGIRDFANGCISKPVPFLEGIFVRPEARGKGVGKALLEFLEDLARSQGFREMGSDVLAENAHSLKFHALQGFEETERVVYFRKEI